MFRDKSLWLSVMDFRTLGYDMAVHVSRFKRIQMKNECRFNAIDIRFVRSVCGVPSRDTYSDNDVRERCGLKEEEVIEIEKMRVEAVRHQKWMDENRPDERNTQSECA
ncbi:hypothetical protein EVAR_18429_1 [Eumeta japonica]|uniref:Uncharacterized protein n=1 Tax=Eumeta variegata TaxID=151549 RepID=A0A4C1UUH5_EUMVA|nr:hypothetical protein EVAR_18429_1 [Eumeta japonica]